jgi:hypothetical protein
MVVAVGLVGAAQLHGVRQLPVVGRLQDRACGPILPWQGSWQRAAPQQTLAHSCADETATSCFGKPGPVQVDKGIRSRLLSCQQ